MAEVTPSPPAQPVIDIPNRVVWGLLGLGLLVFFFVLPHTLEGDGRLRFDALQGWLAGSGIPEMKFPLIGSVPSIPLILMGHLGDSTEWWVSRYNVIVYAAGIGALYLLLRERLPNDVLTAFVLLLGTTAMLPNSLTGFGAETFSAMTVGAGLAAWSIGRWKTGAVLLGVGVANLPASFVGLALAMGWWAWRFRRIRAVAPLVLSAGLWLFENTLRHKSALASGYENDHGFQTLLPYSGLPAFSYPTFFGVPSLIFSFGKGLLFFAPGLFLAFGRGLEALRSVSQVFVFGGGLSWAGYILIAYAVGVTGYVAYPLLRQWTVTAWRDLGLAWAAYGRRSPWGF